MIHILSIYMSIHGSEKDKMVKAFFNKLYTCLTIVDSLQDFNHLSND